MAGIPYRSKLYFGSIEENKDKTSEHKPNSFVQLPAQFEEMSIIENRFLLTLYSPIRLADHLSTQNKLTLSSG